MRCARSSTRELSGSRSNRALEEIRDERPLSRTSDASANRCNRLLFQRLSCALDRTRKCLQAFRHATRVGSGGARLLGGRHREHSLLEEELAAWLGRERALLFSSGYMAALGAIPVLARTVDAVYSDSLNHASLIDGIRIVARARGRSIRTRRCRRRPSVRSASLIVTESIFSMDGDAVERRGDAATILGRTTSCSSTKRTRSALSAKRAPASPGRSTIRAS